MLFHKETVTYSLCVFAHAAQTFSQIPNNNLTAYLTDLLTHMHSRLSPHGQCVFTPYDEILKKQEELVCVLYVKLYTFFFHNMMK